MIKSVSHHIMKNALLALRLRMNIYTTLLYHPIFVAFWLVVALLGSMSNCYKNKRSIATTTLAGTWQLLLTVKEETMSQLLPLPRISQSRSTAMSVGGANYAERESTLCRKWERTLCAENASSKPRFAMGTILC